VYAHGGVAIEFDECVVRIGKFTMHFTAYQSGNGTEYCWELPAPGEVILVRLRRGPQDAPRDIQVPLAPSGSR
jgi:hypothetical protein